MNNPEQRRRPDPQCCHPDPPQPFRPEIIYVNKVYNECSMVDCITLRVPVPPCFPPAVNVVDCAVTDLVAEGFVVGTNEIDVDVTFTLNIEYDSNGNSQFIQQAGQFRRRGLRLAGAVPGMQVVILPLVRCIACRVVDSGEVIECDVGVYIVVKAVALVQLEVMGRFSNEPPLCEQVSPLGCAEWFEMAETGAFWPPFPPQPAEIG
ncbi:MAG TPA: hypothetical protein GX521_05905 [Firmicutes bacterium]|nr:hypothetical protein [Bacillota bacterium]